MKKIFFAIASCSLFIAFDACSPAGGSSPGHEYMPDMGHSVAYEANLQDRYSLNSWDDESVLKYKDLAVPRLPIKGTIPRGYTGVFYNQGNMDAVWAELNGMNSIQGIRTPVNGNVPYYYADNEDERVRASKEILHNPFPITEKGLSKAKDLYNINCGICHGEKGDGAGYLVRDGGKYPAQPANFLQDTFYHSSNGRFYHAIMYGKNVMGSYADKLSYEERWQVIHYIRSLQAKSKNLEYSEAANTFTNNTNDIPGSKVVKAAIAPPPPPAPATEQPATKPEEGSTSKKGK